MDKWPRSVVALCWVLAALHWRYKVGVTTYAGIGQCLKMDSDEGLRQLVKKAKKCGAVVVKHSGEHGKVTVALKRDALRALERSLRGG